MVFATWALGMSLVSSALVAAVTNAPPATPAVAPAGPDGFGQYLVDHQDDLAPIFTKHGAEFARESATMFMGMFGRIMFFSLLIGWVLDIFLSRRFAMTFAPGFAQIKKAIIYATGRLGVSMIFSLILGLIITACSGLSIGTVLIPTFMLIFVLMELAMQTGWVSYVFRTDLPKSALFYVAILAVHAFLGILIGLAMVGGHATDLATTYIDHAITPKVKAEADAFKEQLATAASADEEVSDKVADLQKKISFANSEEERLQKQIEQKKNSDSYLFSKIALVRAQGNLPAARDQLNDLLAKHPQSAMAAQIKAQLAQVESDIATQELQKKQAEDEATRVAAQAQADLMAKAARGEATLSEMRLALIGKTPPEISALFGAPVATDSNRWGYSKQMILDPLTNKTFGLAIYFADGTVQGVNYYYGH